jgi:hypothetical protein
MGETVASRTGNVKTKIMVKSVVVEDRVDGNIKVSNDNVIACEGEYH